MSDAIIWRPGERVTLPRRGRFRGGTDPSAAPKVMLPRPMFDTRPHRNVGSMSIPHELPSLPDDRIVAVMVEHGCPAWSANELRRNPYLRFCGVRFFFDVMDAAEGNAAAKERVELMRSGYQEMRKIGLIDETPDHTIGLWER
jgi:hypothetical protein